MTIFRLNKNVSLQLMIFLHLALINTASSQIQTQDEGLNYGDSFTQLSIGDGCPNADDIKPCSCSSINQTRISMDCSDIVSETQLKEVFSKNFPVKDLFELQIRCHDNNKLKALKSGDLGSVSFIKLLIVGCGMTEIGQGALEGSYGTLNVLSLEKNQLTSVLDLSKFEKLEYLFLEDNALPAFPQIKSKTLVDVNLSGNLFNTIPRETIFEMPSLNELYLYGLNLSDIPIGAFSGNKNLTSLDLSFNLLNILPMDIIKLDGNNTCLWLSNNRIARIAAKSFVGVTTVLDLRHNSLVELKEDVFKSLLEDSVDVMLEDNPFVCDCDLKWLVPNSTLLGRLADNPKCANGTSFINLDPTYYTENC